MNNLISNLHRFNSKERFFLVSEVIGNQDFTPSSKFLNELSTTLNIKIKPPTFSAMDYHLDWLYASLVVSINQDFSMIHSNEDSIIRAQQEDIDFVFAFEEDAITHLVLIEAKGVTGWTNEQLKSKAKRLIEIFGDDGKNWKNVVPHFVITSPNQPKRLDTTFCAKWMLVNNQLPWVKLKTPDNLIAVTRCNDSGNRDKNGRFWKVISRQQNSENA